MRHIIRRNQIYKQKGNNFHILIAGRKRDKWLTKVLTGKPGVYKDTHTMADRTLNKRYELVENFDYSILTRL